MLELMSYGLTGLAAVVVMASCFAYSDKSSTAGEKRSTVYDDKACWPTSRRIGERGPGAIDKSAIDNGVPGGSGPKEVGHA
jgi:hypothetical protein